MKEIAWIFGISAVGKETFTAQAPSNELVKKRLGWLGKRIVACDSSTANIGQFDNDPITLRREAIFEQTPALLASADVVLIKWQLVDSVAHRPQRLRAQLPDTLHSIVLLDAPESELIERLKNKPWWHGGDESEHIRTEQALVAVHLNELQGSFQLTTLSSGIDEEYARKS